MKQVPTLFAFNRGLVSEFALGRMDQQRLALSAETMDNMISRILGPMSFRPGFGYIGASASNNAARFLKFIFSTSDNALVELTASLMRIWIDDVLLTRPNVDSAVTNSSFTQYTDTVTITIASPGVVTYTGDDNWANGDEVTFTTTGALPTGITAGTTYYVVNYAVDGAKMFRISATSGGADINTSGSQSGVHTAAAYNFITGWTDGSDSGGVASNTASNELKLSSNGTARALAYQLVTTSSASIEHALRILVETGPVALRIGSTLGGDEYVTETPLDTGEHSISFTPTGSYYIQFVSTAKQEKLVTSCTVESAGVVTIPTPWTAALLSKVRYDQSGDVLFVACDTISQRKIERRGTRPNARSWSVANYQSDDGPFFAANTGPITLTGSATTGNITVTASQPLFRSTHIGALFSMTNFGQSATATIAAEDTFTDSILVTGLTRSFGITITGDLSAGSTVTLQSSTDDLNWSDVSGQTWTTSVMPVSTAYDDTLLNQQIYYRMGIKTGDYSSADSVTGTLRYNAGSQRGIVRISAVATSLSASAEVITELGATSATDIWQEGIWSSFQGYPTSVRLHEGRLWWFGRRWLIGSVSDDFVSFDETVFGSSGPIVRTLGSGPVDVINWALSLERLIIGAEGREISVRSSAFETPLTPIDTNLKDLSTQGSAAIEAYEIDQNGIFVHRNGIKIYEIGVSTDSVSGRVNYSSADLMELVPELGAVGIVRMDIQRQPDTRIHCVLTDGTALIGVYSAAEKILSWQTVSTDGLIEDVVILPAVVNTTEDQVYYLVNRTVNGSTVRYLEKWAKETECRGAASSKNSDSHIAATIGGPSLVVSGLDHLEGESVVAWGDAEPYLDSNDDPQTFTVSSGKITLPTAAATTVVGLAYTGQWKSTKLGTALSIIQTLLGSRKRIGHIAFMLAYTSRAGFQFGPAFDRLDDMPKIEKGTTADSLYSAYDEQMIPFPSTWTPDLRLCLQAKSPMPATVMAVAMEVETT